MTYEEFERRAHEIFDEIPEEYREGVDGLVVERRAVLHPTLPEIYTLGECVTETYPSDYGGAGEVRSFVHLYYGSFLRLSRLDEEWDWEEELFETVTHEVRHHLESLALEDALEVQDWVEDQNFARREGEAFDPSFHHAGREVAPGVHEVGGDLFFERAVSGGEGSVPFEWEGRTLRAPLPEPLGDVHFLTLEDLSADRGEVVLVLVRRRGLRERLRGLLSGRRPEVLSSVAGTEG